MLCGAFLPSSLVPLCSCGTVVALPRNIWLQRRAQQLQHRCRSRQRRVFHLFYTKLTSVCLIRMILCALPVAIIVIAVISIKLPQHQTPEAAMASALPPACSASISCTKHHDVPSTISVSFDAPCLGVASCRCSYIHAAHWYCRNFRWK